MTNNTDEFGQDQFDAADAAEENQAAAFEPKSQSTLENWRNKPIVKLLAIMLVVGVALAGAMGAFSNEKKPNISNVTETPGIQEAPGGAASQFFIDQNDKANLSRVEQALNRGGSAMPTPVGRDNSGAVEKKDPLLEFRAETERMRREMEAEKKQSDQKVQLLQQQVTQQQVQVRQMQKEPEDDTLAQAMQRQMQQLMDSWAPKNVKVVNGVIPLNEPAKPETAVATSAETIQATSSQSEHKARVLVPAGTVSYVQLLTEANSDVPGPILAQVLSGPLAGGRAIGSFQVSNDYLVITFRSVTLKGKQYSIEGLALDPNTTLGGLATEVDHRYFIRVVLPAAGSFVSAFGDALSETDSTTIAADGAVFQDKAKKGMKEALYSGAGAIGETVSDFFKSEANATQTLVRVAVGTPMGLFFLTPVTDDETPTNSYLNPTQAALLQGYQQGMPQAYQAYGDNPMSPTEGLSGLGGPMGGVPATSSKGQIYQTGGGAGGFNIPGIPAAQQKMLNSVMSGMGGATPPSR